MDRQAHKIQRYKVYREYMERVLEYSPEVHALYLPLALCIGGVEYAVHCIAHNFNENFVNV